MSRQKPTSGGQAKKELTTADFLRSVPHRNEMMDLSRRPGGGLLASIPMKRPRFLVPPLSWILPYSTHRRVELDALGAEVLELCDGRRNVERIIERFAAAHKLTFREGQLAVTQFLRELTRRGLTAIVARDKEAERA